jgi:serine phosphatase RsbU (regulator of sigma subunit)
MINERFLGLLVADATGHGVSSAMLSAMFKMTLSKYSSFDLNPGSVFNKLNQDFCQVLQTGDFFTAFYGIIDLHTNKFMYSNAGHPLPLLYNYSSGDIINLDSEGFILGAMHKGITYETKEFRFNDHYRMLIYTDCLFEEVNNTQKPFGLNRVRNSIARYAQESPDKYLDNIVRDLKKFTGKSIFSDDLTLLVIDIIL